MEWNRIEQNLVEFIYSFILDQQKEGRDKESTFSHTCISARRDAGDWVAEGSLYKAEI